jgi:hypothetical protein
MEQRDRFGASGRPFDVPESRRLQRAQDEERDRQLALLLSMPQRTRRTAFEDVDDIRFFSLRPSSPRIDDRVKGKEKEREKEF